MLASQLELVLILHKMLTEFPSSYLIFETHMLVVENQYYSEMQFSHEVDVLSGTVIHLIIECLN